MPSMVTGFQVRYWTALWLRDKTGNSYPIESWIYRDGRPDGKEKKLEDKVCFSFLLVEKKGEMSK